MTVSWQAAREWGGWLVGAGSAVVGVTKFISERKKTREAEMDARIVAVMKPDLLHATLQALADGQGRMSEQLGTIQESVNGLQADVARLEGINEGRQVVPQSDARLHLTQPRR